MGLRPMMVGRAANRNGVNERRGVVEQRKGVVVRHVGVAAAVFLPGRALPPREVTTAVCHDDGVKSPFRIPNVQTEEVRSRRCAASVSRREISPLASRDETTWARLLSE